MNEQKVNLFIIGAMKAGTTSFADLLSRHSQVYCPPVKEPHFFIEELPEKLYDPGPFFDLNDYLKNKFPEPLHITKTETQDQYRRMYSKAGGEKYLVDASTAYLHAPESAALIHNYNPDAKVIILLRDPLARAFSHYKMNVGKGRVGESFETAILKDLAAYRDHHLPWHSYLYMSIYTEPVQQYRDLFSEVLVVHFEELIQKEAEVLGRISRFLDIDTFKGTGVIHKNIARNPKFPRLLYIMNRLGLKHYFSKLFSSTFKRWLSRKISSPEKFEMELSPSSRDQLEKIFRKKSQI